MSCEQFEYLIALLVECDITEREEKDIQFHLAHCANCRRLRDELQESQAAVKTLCEAGREIDLDPVRSRVMARVLATRSDGLGGLYSLFAARPFRIAAAVIAALAICVSIYMVRSPSNQQLVAKHREQVEKENTPVRIPDDNLAGINERRQTRTGPRPIRRNLKRKQFRREKIEVQPIVAVASPQPAVRGGDTLVKLTTDDPKVIIFWVLERQEVETNDR